MLYAKIALGLPMDMVFDYSVPPQFHKEIQTGERVRVSFRNKRLLGYIVGLTHKTEIKAIKDITELIDTLPILNKNFLLLSDRLSRYYSSSRGEVIEAMLPEYIRKGKEIKGEIPVSVTPVSKEEKSCFLLMHDLDPVNRLDFYIKEIKECLANKKSVIVLFSNIPMVLKAKDLFDKALNKETLVLYRKQPNEARYWIDVRSKEFCIVLGTRSAVFAPVNNLGLIILDHEEDSVYKQEQAPHYHAREAALMRADIEKAKIILNSVSPSLQSYFLAKENKIKYLLVPRKKKLPEVKIIDLKRVSYAERKNKSLLSRVIVDAISAAINEKGRILVFINRKGFATYAACHNCGVVLKCPACNISLVYHFEGDILKCHHCSFKMPPPKICPSCNSGYIKYSGIGTDKIESELARIFPQARFGKDIIVSTSLIIKEEDNNFDLICVLNIDNAINRVDYMSSEKTYFILSGLLALTDKKMIIPTSFPEHHCFSAIANGTPEVFYSQELKFRKQLDFPPYKHLCLIRLRGRNLEKVERAAHDLFNKLKEGNRYIRVLSLNPGQPEKLRGNFYWQILLSAADAGRLNSFLRFNLKDARYSGIIITVDVDPL